MATDEKNPNREAPMTAMQSGSPVVRHDDDIKTVLNDVRHWLDVCFIPYAEAELASRKEGSRAADLAVLRTGENVLMRLERVLRAIDTRDLSLLWFQSAWHRPDGGIEIPPGSQLLHELKRLVGDA